MPIVQSGSINTTSLLVPDLYVQIVPPSVTLLNGVPSNIVGVVGAATWGPVNSPTPIGGMADYARLFGSIQNRKYDLGTAIAAAVLQGANNFRAVRVTDGTDVAATIVVLTNCITFTSLYTGTLGNSTTVTLAAGSAASTQKATVAMPGQVPEVFDNIPGSANAFWVNLANAINLGQSGVRGPSKMIVATAGAGATAATLTTYTLATGTDGATTITSTVLLGVDTGSRTGMYALRGAGCSIGVLADNDTYTSWSTMLAFGLAEGIYMIVAGASGESVSTAVTNKATAGVDSYGMKVMLGDWCYFNDTVNGLVRAISPTGFAAGRLANLSPEQSGLNKAIFGIAGTQKTYANQVYGAPDLTSMGQAGIDVITNPVPGGNYFGLRFGRNCSSNAVIHGDNYTRLINYITATLNAGMGQVIGKLQSADQRREARATLSSFFDGMWQQGMIGNAQGTQPYSVVLDDSNNPPNRVALGYEQADVKVQFLSVIENLIINVEGGQSVQISRLPTQIAA